MPYLTLPPYLDFHSSTLLYSIRYITYLAAESPYLNLIKICD